MFLDIDGVMIPTRNYFTRKYQLEFDPIAVEGIKRLCGRCSAEVVMNTSWNANYNRKLLSILVAKNELPMFDGGDDERDWWYTDFAIRNDSRIKAIYDWIGNYEKKNDDGVNWVCIDDCQYLGGLENPRVVSVDPDLGFTVSVYSKATKILGNNDEFIILI